MNGLKIDYLYHHPQFIPALASFSYQEWLPVYQHQGLNYQDALRSYAERINMESLPLTMIAMRDGELLGTGSLKLHDLEIRRTLGPWLGGMYVVPAWRGRGVATLLIEGLLIEAMRLELSSLYLWTPSAKPLYEKQGWRVCESLDYCGYQGVVMHRAIF